MSLKATREQYISGLRELVEFLEANPSIDLNVPWSWCSFHVGYSHHGDVVAKAGLASFLAGGGEWKKVMDEQEMKLVRAFGPVEFSVEVPRKSVCTLRKVTKTVEVDEWECSPLLGDKDFEDVVAGGGE